MEQLTRIGHYQILHILGQGGMGVVYHARNTRNGEEVALKTVKVSGDFVLESFRREIRTLSRLDHPGVIAIHESGIEGGMPWYTMELLEGQTLREFLLRNTLHKNRVDDPVPPPNRLKPSENSSADTADTMVIRPNGLPSTGLFRSALTAKASEFSSGQKNSTEESKQRLDIDTILPIICNLCLTLAYIHSKGVVHRDLKPENIFITATGRTVLVDFGLVTRFSGGLGRETLTIEHGGAGTISYMAPEQIRSDSLDARTDLYALGCIIFECLTGFKVFEGATRSQIIRAHLSVSPQRVSAFNNAIPSIIDDLVFRLLEKDPRRRPGYAEDVAIILAKSFHIELQESYLSDSAPYLYQPRFYGQHNLQKKLGQILKELPEKGQCLVISGEQGSGKTRILLETGKETIHYNYRIISGECRETVPQPLGGLKNLLQLGIDLSFEYGPSEKDRLFGGHESVCAPFFHEIENVPGYQPAQSTLPGPAARLLLYRTLKHLIVAISANQPLVFFLDDINYADELVLGFITYLHRINFWDHHPFLLLMTVETASIPIHLERILQSAEITHLIIEELDRSAINSLISDSLAVTTEHELITDLVYNVTRGNPYFVSAFLLVAVTEGYITRKVQSGWFISGDAHSRFSASHDIPNNPDEIVSRQISGLSNEERSILTITALIGFTASAELVFSICEVDDMADFDDSIQRLILRQLLDHIPNKKIRFTSAHLRTWLLTNTPTAEKKKIYRLIVESLEPRRGSLNEMEIEKLAHYTREAGRHELALELYLIVARRTRLLLGYEKAESLYRTYVELAKSPTRERIIAYNEFGNLLRLMGKLDRAKGCYEKSLEDIEFLITFPDHDRRKETVVPPTSLSLFNQEKEAELAPSLPLKILKARTIGNLANYYNDIKDFNNALTLSEETLKIARETRDRWIESQVLGNIAMMKNNIGKDNEAEDLYRMSIALKDEIRDSEGKGVHLSNYATFLAHKKRFKEAERVMREALHIRQKVGDQGGTAITLGNLAMLLDENERGDEAIELYQKALLLMRETGSRFGEEWILSNLAEIIRQRGDNKEALNLLQQALFIARELGHPYRLTKSLGNIARIFVEIHHWDEAIRAYEEAIAFAQSGRFHYPEGLWCCYLAHVRRIHNNDIDAAETLLARAAELLHDHPGPLIQVHCEKILCRQARNLPFKKELDRIEQLKGQLNEIDIDTENALKNLRTYS